MDSAISSMELCYKCWKKSPDGRQAKKIADIYKQKGGWEAWLQVELALSIPDLLGGTVTREEHIYSNELGDQRVDLLWNRARQVRYGIELKCQSSGQTVDKGGFYSAFVTDLKKICISRLKTAYQLNTVLVMLGFGVGGVAVEEAKAVFSSSKIGAGEHDVPCRVYWAETLGGHTLFWAVVDERHLYRAAR
ncbi:hypothetical protein BKA70DRAFT_1222183 [Coprinopsis sp. MPI-PUGE-AT-0042]|nr:hypothetical protein BKA70DRAFT_1222183 [Coprinopsis sp. MPI-PUGE-AT-0042]